MDVLQIVPSQVNYQYGSTYLTLLFKPIPRSLMPQKPLGASALVEKVLFPALFEAGFARAATVLVELYLNFSGLGIFLGMFLLGVGSRALYAWLRRSNYGSGAVLLYSLSLGNLMLLVRNDFHQYTTFALFYLIPSVATVSCLGRWKRLTATWRRIGDENRH